MTFTVFGQISLENTYVDANVNGGMQLQAFNSESGIKYFLLLYNYDYKGKKVDYTVEIYNSTHTLESTIDLSAYDNYYVDIDYVYDKLFNNDSNVEFLLQFEDEEYSQYGLILYNDQGEILFDFGKSYVDHIISNENSSKLIVEFQDEEESGIRIYNLPGSISNISSNIAPRNNLFGFPNPTTNQIRFKNALKSGENGTLEIFNMNGVKVFQQRINSSEEIINIDVSSLNRGTYVYKILDYTNKFIKL